MALDLVRLGTPPIGQDGDDPRTAFTRINNNFNLLDDAGISGPIAQAREVTSYNDANQPGEYIGTATASGRPEGFGRTNLRVSLAFDDAITQFAVDLATGASATRGYNPTSDTWSPWGKGGDSTSIIPIERGGTGAQTAEGARQALGIKGLALEDTAPIEKGGTGAQTKEGARQALGLGAVAVEDILPIDKGGTGSATGVPVMIGATDEAEGVKGLVPAAPVGDKDKVLFSDGTWRYPSGGGRFFGEVVLLGGRNIQPNGVPRADGQWIENATAQYPDAVADLQSATPSVPVVTPALWESDPYSRGCWAYDAATDRIRLPDYNGKQAGSIGPVFFRGDGNVGFTPGKIRQDQFQGHLFDIAGATGTDGTLGHATLGTGPANNGPVLTIAAAAATATRIRTRAVPSDNGTNGEPRTGNSTFPTHVVGVYGVVLFGVVSNPGAANAEALATSYANQQADLSVLKNERRGILPLAVVSGQTSIVIEGIPAWASRVLIHVNGLRSAATMIAGLRLGSRDGGLVSAGYAGIVRATTASATSTVIPATTLVQLMHAAMAANTDWSGVITLTRVAVPAASTVQWFVESRLGANTAYMQEVINRISLQSNQPLDRIEITTTTAAVLAGGVISVQYEH
ncbi:hypothetical protein [Pseudomonas xanthosomatis]|uniref:hypothetical protein n=1 Tax=Pseudomonas xanthosomatis TaxID=2842356 RepID=UPI0035122E4A